MKCTQVREGSYQNYTIIEKMLQKNSQNNTCVYLECVSVDYLHFFSTIVEIWFLDSWLRTCNQFQTFQGFS